jgi:hypothetical protein
MGKASGSVTFDIDLELRNPSSTTVYAKTNQTRVELIGSQIKIISPDTFYKVRKRIIGTVYVGSYWGWGTKGNQREPKGTKGNQREPKGTKGNQREPMIQNLIETTD